MAGPEFLEPQVEPEPQEPLEMMVSLVKKIREEIHKEAWAHAVRSQEVIREEMEVGVVNAEPTCSRPEVRHFPVR